MEVSEEFTLRPPYPKGKSPWYPFDTRLGEARAILDGVVKRKIPRPPGIEP
jgi:hypothetical protein